jgi:hypothetical protein
MRLSPYRRAIAPPEEILRGVTHFMRHRIERAYDAATSSRLQARANHKKVSDGRTEMSVSKINRTFTVGFAAAVAALAASPSWAAPQPRDSERMSNTYQTYKGATGCVQDFGYGRIVEACD